MTISGRGWVLAGCACMAPVTALVLVFELTGHYELTLPVMLCSTPSRRTQPWNSAAARCNS